MEYDEFKHYGILGMKWGVRRTPEELGHEKSSSKSAKSISRTATKVGGQPKQSAKLKNSRPQMTAVDSSKTRSSGSSEPSYANLKGGEKAIDVTAEASFDELAQKAEKLLSQLELPNASKYYLYNPATGNLLDPSNIEIGHKGSSDTIVIAVRVGAYRYEYPVRSEEAVEKAVKEINETFVKPAREANAKLAGKDTSTAKSKENTNDKADAIKKKKSGGKTPSSSYTQHSDDSEDILVHYGIIGMKWGIRRTPEELGHAPKAEKKAFKKQVKEDVAAYREQRRQMTSAIKNLQRRTEMSDRATNVVNIAREQYMDAMSAFAWPWKQAEKQQKIAAADQNLRRALEELEVPDARRRQALDDWNKQYSEFVNLVQELSDKYGKENVKQISTKEVQYGENYVMETPRVGINMANFPIINNPINAANIMSWEMEYQEQLAKEHYEDKDRKRYA